MKYSILVLFLFSMLFGCSTASLYHGSLRYKTLVITPGAGKNEVIDLLGLPEDRQFNGQDEAWQYCSIGFANDNQHAIIWFHGAEVTRLEFYQSSKGFFPQCSKYFKTISWSDETIEIRTSRPNERIEIRYR